MKSEVCPSTQKKCLSKRDAKKLVETIQKLKKYYICDYCGKYHVTSLSGSTKRYVDKLHSKRDINESVSRRLEHLKNKK